MTPRVPLISKVENHDSLKIKMRRPSIRIHNWTPHAQPSGPYCACQPGRGRFRGVKVSRTHTRKYKPNRIEAFLRDGMFFTYRPILNGGVLSNKLLQKTNKTQQNTNQMQSALKQTVLHRPIMRTRSETCTSVPNAIRCTNQKHIPERYLNDPRIISK